jgi:hypothetical protein
MSTSTQDGEIQLRSGREVSILARLQLARKRGVTHGLTEEELAKFYPTKDEFNEDLAWLLSNDVIKHFYSQEGTAGNYAHRYKLERDVEIKAHFKS